MNLSKKCILSTTLTGLLFGFLGLLFIIFRPFQQLASRELKLYKGGTITRIWNKPQVDLFLKVYIFNITNKDAFLNGTQKLKVVETGPYVYREFIERANLEFNTNGTVSGVPKFSFEFAPKLSVGTENDKFFLPNVALLSFAQIASKKNIITKILVNTVISQTNSQPIIEQTVKEFLFNYESPLVALGNTYIPDWIKFDKLGLVDRIFDVEGQVFTVYTGETNPHLAGVFATYNRLPYLSQWPSAPCNKVEGASDGGKFPTNIEPNETLWFFSPSMGRAMPMVQTSSKFSTSGGLDVVHYKFRDDIFHYGKGNEENRCFCLNNECLRDGLLDLSMWYYGSPLILSLPHFYQADPTIREETEGTNPEADLHESYFMINPQTGSPIKESIKMQTNLGLGDLRGLLNCEKFSNIVVPLMWTDSYLADINFHIKFLLFMETRVLAVADMTISTFLLISGGYFIIISIRAFINKMCKETGSKKSARKYGTYVKEYEGYYYVSDKKNEREIKESSWHLDNEELSPCVCKPLETKNHDQHFPKTPLNSSVDL